MKHNDIMFELVRGGARKAVLIYYTDPFEPEDAKDLFVTKTKRGYVITKDEYDIPYDITHKELGHLLGMIESDKWNAYYRRRVASSIKTLDGIELHAEVHLQKNVSMKELTLHTMGIVDKFNAVLMPLNIACTFTTRYDRGRLSRYKTLVNNDKERFLMDFAAYRNDFYHFIYKNKEHPIYEALIDADFVKLEQFYKKYLIKDEVKRKQFSKSDE